MSIGSIIYYLQAKGYDADKELTEFREFQDGVLGPVVKRPLFEQDMEYVLLLNRMAQYFRKVVNAKKFVPLSTITTPRNPFGLPDVNQDLEDLLHSERSPAHNIRVQCALERTMYISRNAVKRCVEAVDHWKVYTSKMNGGAGTLMDDKPVHILGRSFIGEPQSICSHALISLGDFNSQDEAQNLQRYMCTKFLRFMVGLKKVSQALYQNVYSLVPLQDFTSASDIDWSKSIPEIDQQLYKKYGLTDDEIQYIEDTIKPMK